MSGFKPIKEIADRIVAQVTTTRNVMKQNSISKDDLVLLDILTSHFLFMAEDLNKLDVPSGFKVKDLAWKDHDYGSTGQGKFGFIASISNIVEGQYRIFTGFGVHSFDTMEKAKAWHQREYNRMVTNALEANKW